MPEVQITIGSDVHAEMQRGPADYEDGLIKYRQGAQSIF